MDRSEKVARLASMIRQVAGGGNLESIAEPRRPASGTLESMTVEEGPAAAVESAAASGLRKLKEGRDAELTPSEVTGLEAIVLPDQRPALFVRGDRYDDCDAPWTHLNGDDIRARLGPLLPSVGRVEVPFAFQVPYGGTAFVVGPDLLMTNRHVARLFVEGTGVDGLVYLPGHAGVDFKREVGTPDSDPGSPLTVTAVEMVHPYWDMALIRVAGLPASARPLKLSVADPADLADRDVAAVGYPARDGRRNDPLVEARIFGDQYNVKRFQPGKLRGRESIDSFEQVVDAVTHDGSTLGGNSGSAVIDVGTGEVVGLHFAGLYLKANYAVPTLELARDPRVVDVGLNFAGRVAATTLTDGAWRRVGGGQRGAARAPEAAGDRRAGDVASSAPAAPRASAGAVAVAPSAGGAATWTIPIQVTVSVGQVAQATVPAEAAAATSAEEAAGSSIPVIYDGLERRRGYQPDFLGGGLIVPMPALTALGRQVAAPLEDGSGEVELRYDKFSIVMHKGRRLAMFSASNVDWRPAARAPGGRRYTRADLSGLPENAREQWVTDWRIADRHQLPDVFFTRDDGAFDKGHLVRRDDVAWGATFEDMQRSNGDTYHATNCTPQVAGFNRAARGDENWGDLETLVQRETKAQRAVVFAGPVLAETDRPFRGRIEGGGLVLVRVPRRFWKILVVAGERGPEAYGFVLEQDLSAVPLELAIPAAWRRSVRSVGDIEELLNGWASLAALKPFDQAAAAARATDRGGGGAGSRRARVTRAIEARFGLVASARRPLGSIRQRHKMQGRPSAEALSFRRILSATRRGRQVVLTLTRRTLCNGGFGCNGPTGTRRSS